MSLCQKNEKMKKCFLKWSQNWPTPLRPFKVKVKSVLTRVQQRLFFHLATKMSDAPSWLNDEDHSAGSGTPYTAADKNSGATSPAASNGSGKPEPK